jgi:hypothetical protein
MSGTTPASRDVRAGVKLCRHGYWKGGMRERAGGPVAVAGPRRRAASARGRPNAPQHRARCYFLAGGDPTPRDRGSVATNVHGGSFASSPPRKVLVRRDDR